MQKSLYRLRGVETRRQLWILDVIYFRENALSLFRPQVCQHLWSRSIEPTSKCGRKSVWNGASVVAIYSLCWSRPAGHPVIGHLLTASSEGIWTSNTTDNVKVWSWQWNDWVTFQPLLCACVEHCLAWLSTSSQLVRKNPSAFLI